MRFEPASFFDRAIVENGLNNNKEQLCEAAFGKRHKSSSKQYWRYGSKGSISFNPATNQFINFSEFKPDGKPLSGNLFTIAAIATNTNYNGGKSLFPQLLAAAAEWLRLKPEYTPSRKYRGNAGDTRSLREKSLSAAADWHSASPIAGTPAEIYYYSRNITSWPNDSVRWHPTQKCIVIAIENITSRCRGHRIITGVEKIYLDENGLKREYKGASKRAHGHKRGNAACFPGEDLSGEFFRTEGTENALSVWLAFEGKITVVATCGAAHQLDLPIGKHFVDLMDDDKEFNSNGKPNVGAERASAALRRQVLKRGGTYSQVWPHGQRTFSGVDFNDLLVESGPDAVRSIIEQQISRSIIPHDQTQLTVKDIPEIIDDKTLDELLSFRQGLRVIVGTVGMGKTRSIINKVIVGLDERIVVDRDEKLKKANMTFNELSREGMDLIDPAIWLTVPTHKLSDEYAERMTKETNISHRTFRGMEADDPKSPGNKMCRRATEIAPHRANMIDVQKEICKTCPLFTVCAYQNQLEKIEEEYPRVIIGNHGSTPTGKLPFPIKGRKIAALIMDESPQGALENKIEIDLSDITEPLHPAIIKRQERAIEHFKKNVRVEFPVPKDAEDYISDNIHRVGIINKINPFLNALDAAVREQLNSGKKNIGIYDFAKVVAHAYFPDLKKSGITDISSQIFDLFNDSYRHLYSAKLRASEAHWTDRKFNGRLLRINNLIEIIRDIAFLDYNFGISEEKKLLMTKVQKYKVDQLRKGWQPILNIEYNADKGKTVLKTVVSKISRRLDDTPIIYADATANLNLIEPMLGRYIDSKIVTEITAPHASFYQDASRTYSKDFCSREKNQKKIVNFILRKTKKTDKVLIITNKSTKGDLADIVKYPELKNCAFAHFNAVAGLDKYKDYDACFVIGRPMPSPENTRDTIHALGGTHDEKKWHKVEKTRKVVRNGKVWLEKFSADGSQNIIANAVIEQIAYGQVIQALGRLRQIWRTEANPCDTYILSDVVIPFAVELLNPADIDEFDDHVRMMKRGLIFDSPKVEAAFSEGTELKISHYTLEERRAALREIGIDQSWRSNFIHFSYKLAGPGHDWQTGLYDADRFSPADVKNIIKEVSGKEIADFEYFGFEAEEHEQVQLRPIEAYNEANFTPDFVIKEPDRDIFKIADPEAPPI